jgi:hypothetical protein
MTRLAPLLAIAFLLAACPAPPEPEPEPEAPVVTPLHEGATSWSDRVDEDGALCVCGDTAGACLHAGPMRAFDVPALQGCTDVLAADTAGALDWRCEAHGDSFRVVSDGLADTAGLATLLDLEAAAWRELSVVITRGDEEVARSEPAVWWSDPVLPLPDEPEGGAVLLDAEGTVYVTASARSTAGVQIDADRVALVTPVLAPLTFAEVADNCGEGTGEATAVDSTCLVAAGGQSCLWIEGGFDGGDADLTVNLSDVQDSVVWQASVLNGWDGLRLGEGSANNLVRHVWINESLDDGLVIVESEDNTAWGMLIDGADNAGVVLWYADGNTLKEVSAEENTWGWYVEGSHANRLLGVWAYDNDQEGFYLYESTGNLLDDVEAGWNGLTGHYLASGADDNLLIDVRSRSDGGAGILVEENSGNTLVGSRASMAQAGIATWDTWQTVFVDTVVTNNDLDGFYADDIADAVVVNLLATNNDEDGVHFSDGSVGVTLVNITSVDNHDDGIELHNTQEDETLGGVLANSVVANNQSDGLNLDESTGVLVSDLFVFASGANAIELEWMDDVVFTGLLGLGGSGGLDCYVDDGDGIEHETCALAGDSDAVVQLGLDLTDSFSGEVRVTDIVNDDDLDGVCLGGDIDDWLGFESTYRAWGIDGDWPAPMDLTGQCEADDSCRIRDWRVETADETLRDVHGHSDGGDAPCPDSAHGDLVLVDFHTTPNTFARHAIEQMLDEVGDEDGLCESGEVCLYSSNLGAYQGEGTPTACSFASGMLSDVEMLVFHSNGAT